MLTLASAAAIAPAAVVPSPRAVPADVAPEPFVERPWRPWRAHFERNRRRALPSVLGTGLPPTIAPAVAWSLARFQIGETGEGRIVGEIAASTITGVDDDYRRAVALFIAEEGRHAHILGRLVRALGGPLPSSTWTERAFTRVRRLAGVRVKMLAMFGAEVIGAAFYAALAAHLPPGATRAALEQIAGDERAHLCFHRDFFATQAPAGWRRGLFLLGWVPLAWAAAIAVGWDHRHTLWALRIGAGEMATRVHALVREGAR